MKSRKEDNRRDESTHREEIKSERGAFLPLHNPTPLNGAKISPITLTHSLSAGE